MLLEFKDNKNATETFVVLIAKVFLLTNKFKIGYQDFILLIHLWEMNQDKDAHQDSSTELVECNQHKSSQELANTPQHIPIHNLPPLEKDRKIEQISSIPNAFSQSFLKRFLA